MKEDTCPSWSMDSKLTLNDRTLEDENFEQTAEPERVQVENKEMLGSVENSIRRAAELESARKQNDGSDGTYDRYGAHFEQSLDSVEQAGSPDQAKKASQPSSGPPAALFTPEQGTSHKIGDEGNKEGYDEAEGGKDEEVNADDTASPGPPTSLFSFSKGEVEEEEEEEEEEEGEYTTDEEYETDEEEELAECMSFAAEAAMVAAYNARRAAKVAAKAAKSLVRTKGPPPLPNITVLRTPEQSLRPHDSPGSSPSTPSQDVLMAGLDCVMWKFAHSSSAAPHKRLFRLEAVSPAECVYSPFKSRRTPSKHDSFYPPSPPTPGDAGSSDEVFITWATVKSGVSPCKRKSWIGADDQIRIASRNGCIALKKVTEVKEGASTDAFRRQAGRRGAVLPSANCCFSVLTDKRSLDIAASSPTQRDAWVACIRSLIAK
jgi:hypothetical protein